MVELVVTSSFPPFTATAVEAPKALALPKPSVPPWTVAEVMPELLPVRFNKPFDTASVLMPVLLPDRVWLPVPVFVTPIEFAPENVPAKVELVPGSIVRLAFTLLETIWEPAVPVSDVTETFLLSKSRTAEVPVRATAPFPRALLFPNFSVPPETVDPPV